MHTHVYMHAFIIMHAIIYQAHTHTMNDALEFDEYIFILLLLMKMWHVRFAPLYA